MQTRTTLTITGMTCSSCRRHVSAALERIEGVQQVEVDLATHSATAHHLPTVESETLVAAIAAEGYGARIAAVAPLT